MWSTCLDGEETGAIFFNDFPNFMPYFVIVCHIIIIIIINIASLGSIQWSNNNNNNNGYKWVNPNCWWSGHGESTVPARLDIQSYMYLKILCHNAKTFQSPTENFNPALKISISCTQNFNPAFKIQYNSGWILMPKTTFTPKKESWVLITIMIEDSARWTLILHD